MSLLNILATYSILGSFFLSSAVAPAFATPERELAKDPVVQEQLIKDTLQKLSELRKFLEDAEADFAAESELLNERNTVTVRDYAGVAAALSSGFTLYHYLRWLSTAETYSVHNIRLYNDHLGWAQVGLFASLVTIAVATASSVQVEMTDDEYDAAKEKVNKIRSQVSSLERKLKVLLQEKRKARN